MSVGLYNTTLCLFLLFIYSSEKAHRVMTCVRASNNETSPIQIWNCDQDDPQKVCTAASAFGGMRAHKHSVMRATSTSGHLLLPCSGSLGPLIVHWTVVC